MKKKINLIKIAAPILFIVCFGVFQILAQEAKKHVVTQGLFWFDTESGTEVYLFPNKNLNYRLTVISKQDVKVTYHTRINSIEPVDKELAPKETLSCVVRYYEFDHYFSKMTIWMTLEFTVAGKKVPALTRTFYDNIFEPVANNLYFEPAEKKKP